MSPAGGHHRGAGPGRHERPRPPHPGRLPPHRQPQPAVRQHRPHVSDRAGAPLGEVAVSVQTGFSGWSTRIDMVPVRWCWDWRSPVVVGGWV